VLLSLFTLIKYTYDKINNWIILKLVRVKKQFLI
jgi:hypothetical protein